MTPGKNVLTSTDGGTPDGYRPPTRAELARWRRHGIGPFGRRIRRGPSGPLRCDVEQARAEEAAERQRREAERARRKEERERKKADETRRRAMEREASKRKNIPRETRILIARARALSGPFGGGEWLRAMELYYEPYTVKEIEATVRACRAERRRRARRPVRVAGRSGKDAVEILERHALDLSVMLDRRRRARRGA